MEVLVTGGAGFIGANLCRRLSHDPRISAIRVLDDLSCGSEANLEGVNVHLTRGSILDEALLAAAAEGVDAIVHLAAVPSVPRSIENPLRSHEVNATGTLLVLEAARRNHDTYVVLASSSSVYGSNPAIPKSEDLQCRPMSPYAVSKLATEQYAMAFASCYDLSVLPFRFFNVYGPLQTAGHTYAAVVPAWLDAVLTGQPLPINGDGSQSRDFTYVETVTDVITEAIVGRVVHGPVNLAFGTRVSLAELATELEAILGKPLEREHRAHRRGDVQHSQASSELVRRLFPEVAPVGLRTGLERTYQWMAGAVNVAGVDGER